MRAQRQLARQLTATENFYFLSRSNQSPINEYRRIYRLALGETNQTPEIYLSKAFARSFALLQPPEATFRNSPLEGHLPALVGRGRITARARPATLVTPTGRFAISGADTASN